VTKPRVRTRFFVLGRPAVFHFALALAVLPFAAAPALASGGGLDPLLRYHEGSDFVPSTPGVAGGAVGAFYNPAAWATLEEAELAFWWNDRGVRSSSLDNWGLSFGKGLGFSVQSRTFGTAPDSTGRLVDYQIGSAWGDRKFQFGTAWRWSAGDDRLLERKSGLMLGTISRPSPYLSIGLSGFLENAVDPYEGIFDIGFRPLGTPKVTLFGDYSIFEGRKWTKGRWGLGAEVRPYRGFAAGVRYRDAGRLDDAEYQLYAGVTLDGLGLNVMPRIDEHGDRTSTAYLIRINPPYRGFPIRERVHKVTEPNRVIPLSLENKVLSYQKPRWFDEKRVPWLDLAEELETIRKEPGVAGIALNLADFQAPPSLQWELRRELEALHAAGKKIFVYDDHLQMGSMYVASVADSLYLDPQGDVMLPGLAAHRTYLRGTLDKLGIGVEEWRYLTYKSAFETLTRKDMSDPDRIQFQRMVDVVVDTWRDGIAAGRHLAPAQVDSIFEQDVFFTPAKAKELGLVDRIGRWPDLREALDKRMGYSLGGLPPNRDRKILPDERWGRPPEIHVVYAVGDCAMDTGIRGRATGKELRRLSRDGDVAAVVLRADSPGGDPLPSDLVAEGIRKCKEHGKPVVVSQGRVAASGGYWISMDGTRILTTPLTITGSIGVIAGWLWDNGVGEKTGITSDGVQRGSHADLFTGTRFPLIGAVLPTRNLDAREKEMIKGTMLDLYDGFVNDVAKARNLPEERVREIAQGRVWMGPDAIDRGLVDGYGTLEDAIGEAKKLAGIPEDQEVILVEYPPRPLLPKLHLFPELPGIRALGRLVFGHGAGDDGDGPAALDYEVRYLKAIAAAEGKPLVLLPPDGIPDAWTSQ
jgi:protease-4